jgi:PBP1b-binding outer membrane lipoprotein LpoB
MIPFPKNMMIQSMNPQIKIEFFKNEEIEEMKNYIKYFFLVENKLTNRLGKSELLNTISKLIKFNS